MRLSTFTDVPMVPGKTFILFDEIQDCKECVTQIKFLVDEGSFRYGLTGSLLGVELNDVRSEPVGYMDVVDVYPLDFEEFALAIGVAPKVIDALRDSFEERKPVDSIVHNQYADGIQFQILRGEVNINHGAIYENVVAQELLSHGFEHLYYFNNKKQGEVDFVLEKGDGTILPVEVKSGKDYAFHLALNNILSNAGEYIPDISALMG